MEERKRKRQHPDKSAADAQKKDTRGAMTVKKRRLFLVLLIAVCVAGCILGICIKKKMEIQKGTTKTEHMNETHFDRICEVYKGKNGSAAIITKNDDENVLLYLIKNRYVAGGKADYTDVRIHGITDHLEPHTLELYIYDIYEKRIVKTIDYKSILEKLPDDYYLCDYDFTEAGGKYWADIDISNYSDVHFFKTGEYYDPAGASLWKHVYIDLETEDAYLVSIGEKISVYDIYEKRVVKTMDYKTISEEYVPGYDYYSSWFIDSFNGKYYMRLCVINAEAEDQVLNSEYDKKYVWIDLEAEEVYCVSDDDSYPEGFSNLSERGRKWQYEIDGEKDTITNFLEEKGLSFGDFGALEEGEYVFNPMIPSRLWSYEDGTFAISVLWSSVSKDHEMLDEYFPGLKDYDAKEDDRVTFLITGYPGKEEIMEILQFLQ